MDIITKYKHLSAWSISAQLPGNVALKCLESPIPCK